MVFCRKAEEYLRLSQVKCAGLMAHVTASGLAVMCLELAARCAKHPAGKVSRPQISRASHGSPPYCRRKRRVVPPPSLGREPIFVFFLYLEQSSFVKLSGLNKTAYQSSVKALECLLGVNARLGMRELAVRLCCTEALSAASEILQR